ncbi:DUF4097 family beta strand repeat-containing protein [Streptomyces pinistramenti]|uniref:DUF4097 family beta strand repeat-containing protein n=1 Tax=Streptomyces pinistramenti TaxID=2884812 RepID=UPI001D06E5BF|nr:DUF4097 family beta strand repeat-containing protein [Streptomyces pinistramenti]MCB5908284.1 DUF4097 domain-containing protein [Streptomyces pinistramenti]
MPAFDTSEPLSVTLEFDMGSVRITASKRADTVVDILPSDAADDADVRAAQQVKVSCSDGKLLIKGSKKRSLFGKSGSLDVRIELPAGSDLHGTSPVADFTCEGRLGDCRLKTSLGDIQIDQAATVNLKSGHGTVRARHVTGNADVVAAGQVDIGEVKGAATVKNANGDTEIGEVAGEVKVNASNGRISVGIAHAGADARSANGGISIGDVARGHVTLQAAAGDIAVGIRESTAAWLDVHTGFGSVRNSLGPAESPGDSDETVEVRARTGVGDILIHRP